MRKLSVLLACNETLPAQAIAEALNSRGDIEVVGTTGTSENTIELVRTLKPDVLIVGVHLYGMDGIDTTRLIHQHYPDVSIIFLSGYNQKSFVISALRAGAVGFLPLSCRFETLVQAMRAVRFGLSAFDTTILEKLISKSTEGLIFNDKLESVNNREIEILRFVAGGKSNRDIARVLYISPRTVQSHLANIFRKLNVTSRTEAVTASISKGYLDVKELPEYIDTLLQKNEANLS